MKSRFLLNMDAEIAEASDNASRLCLIAEKSSYLARQGHYGDAAMSIADIRNDSRGANTASVTAWINYAEGILLHCQGNDQRARDKLHRSLAIANAADLSDLQALILSWLAFLDYTIADIASMDFNVRASLILTGPRSRGSLSRVALTLAQCYHICTAYDEANRWYAKCREKCVEEGDDVMLAALMHNMMWIRTANKRCSVLRKHPTDSRDSHLLLGADSTFEFEKLIGVTSLDSYTPLLRAQVYILEESYKEALDIIMERLATSVEQGLGRIRCCLLADQALCHAALGNHAQAAIDANAAIEAVGEDVQIDDIAVMHSRLSLVFGMLEDTESSVEHNAKAEIYWEKFDAFKESILNTISRV